MELKYNKETGKIIGYALIGSLGVSDGEEIITVDKPDDLTSFEERYEVVKRLLKLKDESARDSAIFSRELDAIRVERNRLLVKSDWRMVADYQGSDQENWKTYRQALRDLTKGISKVQDIVFPTLSTVVVATETVQAAAVTPTWSDIDWYDGDICIYNNVSYTCKRTLLKTWTVVAGDTQNSIQHYWGITNSQLRSWNQAIFDQYKTGINYNLPPVGTVLETVDPINVKRFPDYSNSGFWELTS